MFSVVMLLSGIGVGVRVLGPAMPGRARFGMTLESLLWLHCSISDRCLLECIIETQLGVSGLWDFRGQAA